MKIANFARAVARPTKVDSGILTDFWKAQTMLFLKGVDQSKKSLSKLYLNTFY